MEKEKVKNHVVPVMFNKNFYANKTDKTINAECGTLCCYRFKDKKLFHQIAENIKYEKRLHQSIDKSDLNKFEDSFSSNIEIPVSNIFLNIINKCSDAHNRDIVLNKEEIEWLYKYVFVQLFRYKEIMNNIITIVQNQMNVNNEIETSYIKENYLYQITDLNSKFAKTQINKLKNGTNMLIIKSEKIKFYIGDYPLYGVPSININEEVDINGCYWFLPISPNLCLLLEPKEINKPTGSLIIQDKNYRIEKLKSIKMFENKIATLEELLLFIHLLVSDFIASDYITNETITKVDELYELSKNYWKNEETNL